MEINIYKAAAFAKGFYDSPLWDVMTEPPVFLELFSWSFGGFSYDTVEDADKKTNRKIYLQGHLKEDFFDTIEKKISYLQGVIEEHKCQKETTLAFANSEGKVKRVKKWFIEVAHYRFQKLSDEYREQSDCKMVPASFWVDAVISHKTEYYIPICHTLEISHEIIDFVKTFDIPQELVKKV